MNIENLRAFLEVTSTGSFQKASENLHITQSSVSARIKTLEERLNCELFTRTRTGAVLTNRGKVLHRYALSMVKTWQQARQVVALPDGVEDVISLGVPLHYWNKIGNDWTTWMSEKQPNTATRLHSDYSSTLLHELREGLLDVAILFDYQLSPGIQIEAFSKEQLILVSSTPRDVTTDHAAGYIYVNWGEQFEEQHMQAYPHVPHHRITLSLESQALEQILNQGGSAYLSHSTVAPLLQQGVLHQVSGAQTFVLKTYLAITEIRKSSSALHSAIEGLKKISFYQQYRL